MPVQDKAVINRELQRLGLGTLKDPTLPQQFAAVIRDHDHFRGILMHMPQEQRALWYEAMLHSLRFKAKPLADYEMESKRLAEQNQLPSYDPKTLEVKEFKPQEINSPEYKLKLVAEKAIDRELRESQAATQWTLVCSKCTVAESFRLKSRINGPKIAQRNGWTFIENGTKALCGECSPKVTIN